MSFRLSFVPANAAYEPLAPTGMVFTATASSPAGGVGTMPLDGVTHPAILIVNLGGAAVYCRWDHRLSGPAATAHDFVLAPGHTAARVIPAPQIHPALDVQDGGPIVHPAAALTFWSDLRAASLGVIAGSIMPAWDLPAVDGKPSRV